jgi:carboxypeptidase C (cathepsin A)
MADTTESSQDVSFDTFLPTSATSEHTLKLASGSLCYEATATWITLRKIHKPIAHVFHTAYVATEETAAKNGSSQRPLTFVFNGGPGAASAFLHMGALGPRRVVFGPQGTIPESPVQVTDNIETWLEFTDLVFIDPLGTGFSRAVKQPPTKADSSGEKTKSEHPEEDNAFWEIERDIDSLGDFICRYLSQHNRWTSPLYIAGESYGGFRVAKMARKLQEEQGVALCGAMLISPAIEFDGLLGSDYNLTHWIELLPSLAASAFQHGLSENDDANATTQSVFEKARQFAMCKLPPLLAAGEMMPQSERTELLADIARMTGLPLNLVSRCGGRITATTFCRELLRDQRQLCGHYDASVTTVDPFPDRNDYEGPDPTLFSIDRLFAAAINQQLRTTLKLDTELDYRLLSMNVHSNWQDKSNDHVFRRSVGAMDDLRYGMSLNEHMQVFISHGYFDLVTPLFSSERLRSHSKLTESQQDRLHVQGYFGGHMFYSWDESRVAFRNDSAKFYEQH